MTSPGRSAADSTSSSSSGSVVCAVGLWMASDARPALADARAGHRLPVLLGGRRGRSLLGRARHGRQLLDPPGGAGVVRESGAPDALRRCARHLPVEMRSSSGAVVASFASAMVLFSVVSMGWATGAAAESTLFLAQNGPAASVNTPSAGIHADRPARGHVFDGRARRPLHVAHVPRSRVLDRLSAAGRATAPGPRSTCRPTRSSTSWRSRPIRITRRSPT